MKYDWNYFLDKGKKGITTIAARPGCGKVHFAMNLMSNIKGDKNILYINLEDDVDTVKIKYLCMELKKPYGLVKQLEDECNNLLTLFELNNSDYITISDDIKDLKSLRRYLSNNKVDYIFIDYIQLFDYVEYSRLRKIVDEYEVNMFVISQLGREVEKKKRPSISDVSSDLVSISDEVILMSKKDDVVTLNVYENEKLVLEDTLEYDFNLASFERCFVSDKLYNKELDERLEYLKKNSKYDVNKVIDVIDDAYDNLYVLLNNGELFINDKKVEDNILSIHLQSIYDVYAISKDNRVIPLTNKDDDIQKYMSNDNCSYKKVINGTTFLAGLTSDGLVKIVTVMLDVCVIPDNLVNVEDIIYDEENDELLVSHDNKEYVSLFIS